MRSRSGSQCVASNAFAGGPIEPPAGRTAERCFEDICEVLHQCRGEGVLGLDRKAVASEPERRWCKVRSEAWLL
jgi:hypothetical protein